MKNHFFKPLQVIAFVLLVFIFILIIQCAPPHEAESIRVMSFNIRYDNPDDGDNRWENRKEMVASTLRFHGVDIAGLQEALHGQVADLETLLPQYAWFGVGRDDGKEAGEYSPIFYLKNRFSLLESSTFWLSETPDTPGSRGWDAACNRIVTWGKFEDKNTRDIFYVFNTHFDHRGETAGVQSAKLLLNRIDAIAETHPVILTGDFNAATSDSAYTILTRASNTIPGVSDAVTLSESGHYGSTHTFNGFGEEMEPGHRIDFIFVRNVGVVLHHGVIAEKSDGRFASDHYPVIAEIRIEK
ncbi:MAG: endonuclease/exonuclease/phosphatase family protein [bacterium]